MWGSTHTTQQNQNVNPGRSRCKYTEEVQQQQQQQQADPAAGEDRLSFRGVANFSLISERLLLFGKVDELCSGLGWIDRQT